MQITHISTNWFKVNELTVMKCGYVIDISHGCHIVKKSMTTDLNKTIICQPKNQLISLK